MPDLPSKPELLLKIALDASHKQVRMSDEITEALESYGFSHKQATEKTKTLKSQMKAALDEHLSTFVGRRLSTYYQRPQDNPEMIIPTSDAGIFRWTADVQLKLFDMGPRKFELLLGNVLRRMECIEVAVTPATKDGGFDVIGKIDLDNQIGNNPPLSGPSLLDGQCIYFFGQAKRYNLKKPVEVSEVQSLVGSIDILKGPGSTPTIDSMRKKLIEWGWSPAAPVIPFFATSGRYRSTIHGLARSQKYSIFDGEQLAQRILILYPNIDHIIDVNNAIRELSSRPLDGVTIL